MLHAKWYVPHHRFKVFEGVYSSIICLSNTFTLESWLNANVISVVWFDIWIHLKEYITLKALTFFYQEIMAENSFVGQFQILPNTSPSFHYNALIFFPSQFPICHGVHTKSAGTNGYLFSFFLVKYVSWSTCFFLSKIVLCTLSECILKPWGHKKFSV